MPGINHNVGMQWRGGWEGGLLVQELGEEGKRSGKWHGHAALPMKSRLHIKLSKRGVMFVHLLLAHLVATLM